MAMKVDYKGLVAKTKSILTTGFSNAGISITIDTKNQRIKVILFF